jgi:hypothetical protein
LDYQLCPYFDAFSRPQECASREGTGISFFFLCAVFVLSTAHEGVNLPSSSLGPALLTRATQRWPGLWLSWDEKALSTELLARTALCTGVNNKKFGKS